MSDRLGREDGGCRWRRVVERHVVLLVHDAVPVLGGVIDIRLVVLTPVLLYVFDAVVALALVALSHPPDAAEQEDHADQRNYDEHNNDPREV